MMLPIPTLENKLKFFSKFGYKPHGRQIEAHRAVLENRFVTLAAGARGGKSLFAGSEGLFKFLLPDKKIWCVSVSYELADKTFDWFLEFAGRLYLGDKRLIDVCKVSSASRGSRKVVAPWGSWIATKSSEKPQGLLGEELDLIIIDEGSQMARSPWDRMLSMRITSRKGSVIMVSTPNGDGGLLRDFYDQGQSEEWPGWWSTKYSTWDNPYIDQDELEMAKKRMTDLNYREQVLGEFVSRRGRVFEIREDSVQEVEESFWCDLPIFVSLRPATNNPFVILYIAIDVKNKRYFVIDEDYLDGGQFRKCASLVKEKMRGRKHQITFSPFYDPGSIKTLKSVGLKTRTNKESDLPKKQSQIRRIQLTQDVLFQGHTSPRVVISPKCENLIRDLESCTWRDGREEKNMANYELPLDLHLGGPEALSNVLFFCEKNYGNR